MTPTYHQYRPGAPLSAFVSAIWSFEGGRFPHAKERVLPTGTVELVINLHEDIIRSYGSQDHDTVERFPGIVVTGTRSEYMVIDVADQVSIMGIHFAPGGAFPFLGVPAGEVHDMDVPLEALWGADAVDLRERLLASSTVEGRFRIIERALCARLSAPPERHPAVGAALRELAVIPQDRTLAMMTSELGLSHRRFIELFRAEVGMTPKLYYRIQRFQMALRRIERGGRVEWADLALACGYYDQAHFIRDFRAFSGINPSTYAARHGGHLYHLPIE